MKKLIKYGVIAYAAYYFFTKSKNVYSVYNSLKIEITKIGTPKFEGTKITVPLTVGVTNPTDAAMTINTNAAIAIKKVHIYGPDNKYVGTATPDLIALNLPPHQTDYIQNIPTVIQVKDLPALLALFKDLSTLKTTTEIDVLGQIITI